MAAGFQSSRHVRPILIADWKDAEEFAAWHMREMLRHPDAQITGDGSDGGLDVVGTNAAAQVKHYAGPVGGPDVQRLRGAAFGCSTVVFYALNGYTDSAVSVANGVDVALFSYNVHGDVLPVGKKADELLLEAKLAIDKERESKLFLSDRLSRLGSLSEWQEAELRLFVAWQIVEILLRPPLVPPWFYDTSATDSSLWRRDGLMRKWAPACEQIFAYMEKFEADLRSVATQTMSWPEWIRWLEAAWDENAAALTQTRPFWEIINVSPENLPTTKEVRPRGKSGKEIVDLFWSGDRRGKFQWDEVGLVFTLRPKVFLDNNTWTPRRWNRVTMRDLGVIRVPQAWNKDPRVTFEKAPHIRPLVVANLFGLSAHETIDMMRQVGQRRGLLGGLAWSGPSLE